MENINACEGTGQQYRDLRNCLEKAGLFHDETLLLVKGKGIFNSQGEKVSSLIFGDTPAPYAVYTYGPYSRQYAGTKKTLRASVDDMAQMFGPEVKTEERLRRRESACLISGRGFVVTGRFMNELKAAAILMEKACQTEILSEKIGRIHYLPPLMAQAEHAVYLLKYSRHEKEAADERK